MAEEIVVIGKITSAFGVKGGVKVFSYTKPRLNILNYSPWLLKLNGQWQPVERLYGRQQGKSIAAELKGYSNRDQAEALAGVDIAITSDQLPQLSNDEFYWRDLVGMRVVNQEAIDFGLVSHLIETGSNDVLVVLETAEQASGKKRKERMIPFTQDAVINIDREAQLITVEWDADF
ncbi:ribosome maturation factor RimM [Pleionea litopenaei]|uniref:Ribosome maturation factor RimM n=1 Tax=Pleionea litopenaei TaxID=3070815 RepID=A0AA51X7U9_9GAMM|nr:ribosome maturation factor RimM [Pleionea sp. HL-JVS1]WMS88613.1 ribosome maturation factor RimM [Pleionea sp. HL-JVS1]